MSRITDKGSVTQRVRVQVQGDPTYGLIDSGTNITIIEGSLFKKVAAVAKLWKHDFMKSDKVPCTYNQHCPFQLDGPMDLNIGFGDSLRYTSRWTLIINYSS